MGIQAWDKRGTSYAKMKNGLEHNVNETVLRFWLAELTNREDDWSVACIRKQMHI